ncbi:MAG: hypothetical protein OXG82_21875 [Gammaproteobacteria bacterium]|nr:hypothetical protein [Gammaproteobacteria bacterium]
MASAVKHFAGLDFIGPDASTFLQGYLTADLDALQPRNGLPMALCNIKGRAVASGWAFGEPDHVRLVVHASVVPDIHGELGKYLLFAKSKLAPVEGGLHFAQEPVGQEAVAFPGTGYWLHPGADEGHDNFANACVEAGFVVVAKPVSQTFLPQMIGLTDVGAVSFSKGCYLGQEVVARAQHRGEVKRKLRRYRFDGRPPVVGDDVMQDTAKVGTITAVGAGIALACTRSDTAPATASGVSLVSAD